MFRTGIRHALLALVFCFSSNPMPASAGDVTTVTLRDSALQMTAATMQIPAGWKFQGEMITGSPCDPNPYPVFRAYSADGLSEVRAAPPLVWAFANNTRYDQKCPTLNRSMDATEFLTYYRGLLGVKYDGEMSVAPAIRQRQAAMIAQMNQNPAMHTVGDTVAERVEGKNGTFKIEEQLRANVRCTTVRLVPRMPMTVTTCKAYLLTLRAPKGRLDALAREIDANHLPNVQFSPAYQGQIAQIQDAIYANFRANGRAEMAASQERIRAAFEQSTAMLNHEHQQFMDQMTASFHSSMNNANAAMNARSTAASDWTDYSLDQQSVTGSGGLAKVSSAYANTWSNGQGQWYQTNDPNANPNGVLQGNWSQQKVVHGNGTPK